MTVTDKSMLIHPSRTLKSKAAGGTSLSFCLCRLHGLDGKKFEIYVRLNTELM